MSVAPLTRRREWTRGAAVRLVSGDEVRRAGGGRKSLAETDPTLLTDLKDLVDDDARGDPESPLRWTAKSVHTHAGALRERGHRVSHETT